MIGSYMLTPSSYFQELDSSCLLFILLVPKLLLGVTVFVFALLACLYIVLALQAKPPEVTCKSVNQPEP